MQHTGQFDILIFSLNEVTLLAQFSSIEMGNRNTEVSKSDEFSAVDAVRIREDTTSINHSNRLVGRKQDFI
jgi:hypothetical protein